MFKLLSQHNYSQLNAQAQIPADATTSKKRLLMLLKCTALLVPVVDVVPVVVVLVPVVVPVVVVPVVVVPVVTVGAAEGAAVGAGV